MSYLKRSKGLIWVASIISVLGIVLFQPNFLKNDVLKKGMTNLKIVTGEDGHLPYSKNAPIHAIETTLNAILGKLIIPLDHYNFKPGLLENYYYDFEKNIYVLELRKDLYFHNGRKANSQDLEFSLIRGFFSKEGKFFKSFLDNIEGASEEITGEYRPGAISGVQILDRHKVSIKLIKPNPSFLHTLTQSSFSLVPREELEDDLFTWRKHPVGTGEFKVIKVDEENGQIQLERVRESKKEDVQFLEISSNGFEGDTDIYLGGLEEKSLESGLKKLITKRVDSITAIWFNYNNELGKDILFRKLVNQIINRGELASGKDEFFPTNHIIGSHLFGRIEELNEVDKISKEVLAQFKDKGELRIPVLTSSYEKGYIDKLTKQFKDSGINIKFFSSNEKWLAEDDRETPFRIFSIGADVADPLIIYSLFRSSSPLGAHVPHTTKDFEILYKEASKAKSLGSRNSTIQKISFYLRENILVVPLFERKAALYYRGSSISDIGDQNGGSTFYFDRLKVK